MDAALEAAVTDARLILTQRRDGYALVRRHVAVPDEPGVDDDLPGPLTRATVLTETVVGYCRLPTTATSLAATLTTLAPPGVVFAAVHGDIADAIRQSTGQPLIPAHN